jgi:hypothetical protein
MIMEKLISDKELECINASMMDVMNNAKIGIEKLVQIIQYFNEGDCENKKNLRELLEMNKSFSDYFDMIEDRLKVILSKLDNFHREEDYDGIDIETLLNLIDEKLDRTLNKIPNEEEDSLDELENKLNNPDLDKIPDYAKVGITIEAPIASNKLPIDQVKCTSPDINELFSNFGEMVKEMLKSSDIEYITNDDYLKSLNFIKEMIENISK